MGDHDQVYGRSLRSSAGRPSRAIRQVISAPVAIRGIGFDTANYFYATAGLHVGVDLEAGDERPGDDDQIRRDVESVIGSSFADVLVGSPRTTRLSGEDGDDRITGGSGPEQLLGGDGQDRIDARDGTADTVDCGGQMFDRALVDRDAEAAIARCAEVEA